VAGEDTYTLAAEGVPDVARPVVVATKEDAAGDREGDGGDAAQDVVVGEYIELAVGTDIEQTA
jgi:hypothetical protein